MNWHGPLAFDEEQGRALLRIARDALEELYGERELSRVELALSRPLGGVFATLECDGELRGCIGYLLDEDPVELTRRAVAAAARSDPRFPPVRAEELPRLRITISVLGRPVLIGSPGEIVIGRHGLIVERNGRRGLLLPQVAEERGWDGERFLSETCLKADLPVDSWKDPGTLLFRFEGVRFREESPSGPP